MAPRLFQMLGELKSIIHSLHLLNRGGDSALSHVIHPSKILRSSNGITKPTVIHVTGFL